jgi:molybdopterin synthase catalytic subunit
VAEVISVSKSPIDPDALRRKLIDPAAGAYCSFEGWVRNLNEGQTVLRLEYEAYAPLAISEGEKVLAAAQEKWPHLHAHCVHREGLLEIGDCAVWVGVSSPHRDEAFQACRFIIDEVKVRLPIWKKEHYVDGNSGWVNCERCATA